MTNEIALGLAIAVFGGLVGETMHWVRRRFPAKTTTYIVRGHGKSIDVKIPRDAGREELHRRVIAAIRADDARLAGEANHPHMMA
jgi:hypothetical protein